MTETAEILHMSDAKPRLHCVKCHKEGPAPCACSGATYISAAEARIRRKEFAIELYRQGLTQTKIAEKLSASRATIENDLSGLTEFVKPSRPKGGRPKGTSRGTNRPKLDRARDVVRAKVMAGEPISREKLAKEHGLSNAILDVAIAREEGRQEAAGDPEIDVRLLAKSAQEKLAAAERQMRKRVTFEVQEAARIEMQRRLETTILPGLRQREADADKVIKARKGVITDADYRLLLRCIHPDTRESASPELLRQGYDLLVKHRLTLVAEKENPTEGRIVPSSLAEWDAMRQDRKKKSA